MSSRRQKSETQIPTRVTRSKVATPARIQSVEAFEPPLIPLSLAGSQDEEFVTLSGEGSQQDQGSTPESERPEPPIDVEVQPLAVEVQPVQEQPEAERQAPVMAVYNTFPLTAVCAASGRWVSVEILLDTLHKMLEKKFSVVSERDGAAVILNSMVSIQGIWSKNKQFPEGAYVNVHDPNVVRLLKQIRSGLAYKEFDRIAENAGVRGRESSKSDSTAAGTSACSSKSGWDFNDAHMAVMNGINALMEMISEGKNVYDAERFEKTYNIAK